MTTSSPPTGDGEAVVGGADAVGLGDVQPARSRHAGRRSAVTFANGRVVVGTAGGAVRAFDPETPSEAWASRAGSASVVAATSFGDGCVAVGERGPLGEIRVHDVDTGDVRWRYETADDVGGPQKDTRFFLPFVADLVAGDEHLFVAARRYERDGDSRAFTSVVYAFDADGAVAWTFETDASPIALDANDGRLAVAYNRCPGDHQHGLVVLDATDGSERLRWDPGTRGQRRVGDVSLLDDGVAVASHGDYRGYRLDDDGDVRWRVDLATPTDVGDETLYAYPNHVHATADSVVFVTGNTYPEEGRETDGLHPAEHTAFGYGADGERRWTASVGGFASGVGTDGDLVAVPGAQHFRERDAAVHGVRVFDAAGGPRTALDAAGVVTAAAIDDGTVAAVAEPVVYHDEGTERGAYRLLLGRVPDGG